MPLRLSSHPAGPAAPYGRTLGLVLLFLAVTLFVKFADLLVTFELDPLFQPPTPARRVAQLWMSLRFSWQEFAIGAALIGLVLAWQHRTPVPGRATRLALGALRLVLVLAAALSVAGIKYYSLYHGHMLATDFAENIPLALQIAASARPLEVPMIQLGAAVGLPLLLLIPWAAARLSARNIKRLGVTALTIAVAMTTMTWAAGRPRLQEAQLEPSPLVWFVAGPWLTFVDPPSIETLAPIGQRHRRHEVTERPRNVILIHLESVPAHVVAGSDPAAPIGRRLFADYGSDITLFEQMFAVVPISDSGMLSVLTGWSPVPNNTEALRALEGRPTLSEILKARGYHTEFLLTGPRNTVRSHLVARGFDRALFMQDRWPNDEQYARLGWGPDDRIMFDYVQTFLASRGAGAPPFMLVMGTSNAHHPYQSGLIPGLRHDPDPKIRHRLLAGYVLELLTDLYASLKASGLAESTVVIAFGDHGQAFGEHRGNYVHSKELYRENLHVPMLLLHPRRLGLPPRIPQLGSMDDVMPTVLDLLGFPVPPGSGMSLLDEAPDRTIFHMTPFGPGVAGFRDRRFFYSLSRTGRELLFDRVADPLEQQNVLDRYPDVARRFRDRLEGRLPPS